MTLSRVSHVPWNTDPTLLPATEMLAQNSSFTAMEDLIDVDSTHSDADACFAIEGAGNAGDHAHCLEPKLASVLNTVGPRWKR
jgi:hypothetical protein